MEEGLNKDMTILVDYRRKWRLQLSIEVAGKKKKKNVYFDRMFLVRRPTIKAYNEAASMHVT